MKKTKKEIFIEERMKYHKRLEIKVRKDDIKRGRIKK